MLAAMERMMNAMRQSMAESMRDAREWTSFGSEIRMERGEDGFVVVADIPGFETEEIDLRFDDGMLTLEATHEVSEEADGLSAAHSRQVRESIRVPGDVAVDEISATYHNGVLEIRLPLESAQEDDATRIDIE